MTTLDDNLRRIDELAALEFNWDGYKGEPPGPVALDLARMAVTELDRLGAPVYSITPLPEGDVCIGIDDAMTAEFDCFDDGVLYVSMCAGSAPAEACHLPSTPKGVAQAFEHLARYREKHKQ